MEKVSVIMPCYNDGNYIEEAVQSVFNQTYENIELIIIDDGSTDEKTKQILSVLEDDARIKLLHTQRRGPAGARNIGIEYAQGTYIMPLDSDDRIVPSYIEKAVSILSNNPQIGVVYCYANLFGEKNGRWDLPEYRLERMLVKNIVFVSALFRKKDWIEAGGFSEQFKYGLEDYDFWLSILELGRDIYQIPEVLFYYRVKSASRTTYLHADLEKLKESYRLLYKRHKKLYANHKSKYWHLFKIHLMDRPFLYNMATKFKLFVRRKL